MNLSDLTTKIFGDKKRWWAYKTRAKALPDSYRTALAGVERYLMYLGGITKGDVAMQMMEDLVDLFEQSAANGTSIREIVGEDPVEFIETFLQNYEDGRWLSSERERLIKTIEVAEQAEGSA